MSTISEVMKEMNQIVLELKILNEKARQLRNRKKELESQVIQYLEDTETPGLKYHDLIVLKAETTSKKPKNKKDKDSDLINTLHELGISDTKKATEAIKKALSGQEEVVTKLKFKTNVPEIF